ncbi:2-phospho-L-lactate guanylyltransferase [Cellulomonas cellasea]|uniref:Phosphoenolpyruvate guanylyltransferase n=1 Tax=Cellulomonas cellasea TaxID=43670 RepID=A0A7W4YDV7_9CELL|nr:2-phospho-L-lactate guanylyltransferase [Cellulomonas cellasea]MBB2924971.1 2-phospho-L-lactate guanylyltransferase [Cellulomonas cellasea]
MSTDRVGTHRWSVVVPVKAAALGKTRLAGTLDPGARTALVRAMAADTLAAVSAAGAVARVVVVTGDAAFGAAAAETPGVEVLAERTAAGLDAAVRLGIARARDLAPHDGVAVVLGDLPALRPDELDDVLARAGGVARAFVADAEGTGTTVLTARAGHAPRPRFGAGSAAAHTAAGHVRLAVPRGSGAEQDVDVAADLDAVAALRVGERTRQVLHGLGGRRAG